MNPMIAAAGIETGSDLLGSLLGYGAKKKAQTLYDKSIADLEKELGRPIFNVGQIQSANRAAMFPRIKEQTREVGQRYNLDQPRVKQYLMDQLFNQEAQQLPGLLQRKGELESDRATRIRQAIAAYRAGQLG